MEFIMQILLTAVGVLLVLSMVDNAQKILTDRENEVIDLVKIYKNKLTKIAKAIGRDKAYVFNVRNRAIKKMSDYIGRK